MATKTNKTTNDIKTEQSLIEIIQDINFRLTHLEDIETDNRKLIVKLVQQGNTMVEFLQKFDIQEIDPEELMVGKLPELPFLDEDRVARTEGLKDLIDDIIEKHKDLKELLMMLSMGLSHLCLMLVHRIWRNTGHWSHL